MSAMISQVNRKHVGISFLGGMGVFFILSLVGIVPASFSIGPFEFGSARSSEDENSLLDSDPCLEYGIDIIEPAQGYTTEDGWVTIKGRYQKSLPRYQRRLSCNF